MAKKVKRLIEQFVPEHYDLTIELVPDKKEFYGTAKIIGRKVGRPSSRITFHQNRLKIGSANIVRHDKKGDTNCPIDRVNLQNKSNEARLHTKHQLYPGRYTIEIEFSGTITDSMVGLYPCYFQKDGEQKFLLATQFESHHAREVFPCIDEPEAKATYCLSLVTPKDDTVLSNTPIKTEKLHENKRTTTFEKTPIMSSYLLAFVTGYMHYVEHTTNRGVLMRSWAHAGQPKRSLHYANEQAVRIIEFFESYFDTPFPLSKCDQVALPDFEVGAMENWGLITYREVALLTDPDNRSITSEQYVSMVIAHELSHQWFGNLVTMKWWDDLWLNESFASLMEHVALAELHPTWHQWEQYVSTDVLVSSNRDVYQDVQSVRVDVSHPDEIATIFDGAIVYAKGGRLLKMLHDYIGEQAFRDGLKHYFDTYKYQNTTRDDLWDSLGNSSGKDIHEFMNPWLEQSGMPILSIHNHEDKTISLDQSRFLLDKSASDYLWHVPLFTDVALDKDTLDSKSSIVRYSGEVAPLFNVAGSGHYVVNYTDDKGQARVRSAIQELSIPSESRINSLNDMILLNKRGDLSIKQLLEVVVGSKQEDRDAIWSLHARIIGLASLLAEDDPAIERGLKNMKRELGADWHSKLGWYDAKGDDPNTTLLRTTMVGFMIGGEDKNVIKEAIKIYDNADSLDQMPSELRTIVLGAVVRHRGDSSDIDRLIESYKTTTDPSLLLSISGALTHTKDHSVAKQLLEDAIGPEGFVRPQDIFRWYAYMMRNKHTRPYAWQWLTESWPRLEDMYEGGKSFDHFIIYSSGVIHTTEWQHKFDAFFDPKKNDLVLSRNIKIAQSEIESRVEWHNRNYPELKIYFSK